MQLVTQFSIFLVNKPGVLAQIMQRLAQRKVNVAAMTMMDSSEHGVLRLVASESSKARDALAELNLPTTETEVIVVEMPNQPGALASVCAQLAKAHVNISYAYCSTGAHGGKTRAIFKVADTKKATKVLKPKESKRRKVTNKKVRTPAVLR